MATTYRIEKGKLYELNTQYARKYFVRKSALFFKKFIFFLFGVFGSFTVTWIIYQDCVTPIIKADGTCSFSMLGCITTGSLFATFGSSVIAVFTLFASRYLAQFYEYLSILTHDMASDTLEEMKWKRWSFLPRVSRLRFPEKTEYLGLETAVVVFIIENFEQNFPLPTTEADFKELPILSSLLRMKGLRKKFLWILKRNELLSEYLAWDCMTAIYRNILLYRLSYFGVWIGVCLVLQSILFAFFYPAFYRIALQIGWV